MEENKKEQFQEETLSEDQTASTDVELNEESLESNDSVESLESALNVATEWENKYKRLQADFDNFRRRTNQEKDQLAVFIKGNVLEDLLPVLDNFERAVSAPTTTETKSFLDGFIMIHQNLMALLSKQGLAPIDAVGKAFDPNYHQAVMRVPSEEYEDDIVCEVLQTGYTVDGRVIRPAMVKVVHNG